jgi:hypothetical protein
MTTAALLREAANVLEKGKDPFTPEFLGDHGVTIDQCIALADQLAIGARIVAAAIENPRSPAGIAWATALAEAL